MVFICILFFEIWDFVLIMFEITNKQILSEGIKRIDIYAPGIAKKVKPGQYVSICPQEGDERIPLTVVDWDLRKGTIALIFREVGETTGRLGALPINEAVCSILGPLGVPSDIEKRGLVVCIATDIGSSQILPICRANKSAGNKVVGIVGAKKKKALMLEAQMRLSCSRLYITTNDGSYEKKGLATDVLNKIIETEDVSFVYAVGSIDMMQAVCVLTKPKKIPTRVQLKPVMVDCMGMCGACRVKVGGKTVLACTEGPEFDGHKVDFKDLNLRIKALAKERPCHNQKFQPSHQKVGSKTLMKYLLDILKN